MTFNHRKCLDAPTNIGLFLMGSIVFQRAPNMKFRIAQKRIKSESQLESEEGHWSLRSGQSTPVTVMASAKPMKHQSERSEIVRNYFNDNSVSEPSTWMIHDSVQIGCHVNWLLHPITYQSYFRIRILRCRIYYLQFRIFCRVHRFENLYRQF